MSLHASPHIPRPQNTTVTCTTTTTTNQIPLLKALGYEVYFAKGLPDGVEPRRYYPETWNRHDQGLTLPAKDIAFLNSVNFYKTPVWSERLSRVVHKSFDFVITSAYREVVENFLTQSTLPVGIRVFGLTGNNSYSDWFDANTSKLILQNKSRCYFLAAYDHIVHVEVDFKDMFYFAPITCEPMDSHYAPRLVTDKALLFRCSDCVLNQTAKATKFLEAFEGSGLDFYVYSTDKSKFNDPRNLGVLTPERMKRLFSSLSAMFYDSQDPRHLHYSPLEAMWAQMPVVFLEEGMLGSLLPYSPAKSANVEEAKEILRRLAKGDSGLEREIVWHQNALLQKMRNRNNKQEWSVLLRDILKKQQPQRRHGAGTERRKREKNLYGA